MAVLDTDILVSLLRGEPDATAKLKSLEESGNQLSTTIITAYELLKGAYISSKSNENLPRVRDSISSLQLLELSIGACEEASEIYADLRRQGRMTGEFDVLIAAITRHNDEALVTRDEHFRLIQGMKLVKW